MSKTSKILRTLVVVGVVGSLASLGVFSAFSSQTDNPGNEVAAGTVTLADNDSGAAAYNIQNAKPGDTDEACITVTYTGSLDADVKLYTTATSVADLGPHVDLVITPGTQAVPNMNCVGFAPDVTGAIFTNTLANFQSTHNAYSNGLVDNPLATSKWATNNVVTYKVKATLNASAPDTAQGDTTGVHTIRWEARNQ